jgi:hypothetical protein
MTQKESLINICIRTHTHTHTYIYIYTHTGKLVPDIVIIGIVKSRLIVHTHTHTHNLDTTAYGIL